MENSMLSGIRVLELSDEKGLLCGKILADMGADVIKIEKPEGDKARSIGPFFDDVPEKTRSLFWFAYNLNKRGITLNIDTSDGQEILKKLVATADCLLESFPPGYMDRFGLGYFSLEKLNPGLIMSSITFFGQTGPYRDYKASDIVAMGMGGYLYLCGDPDRPPLRIGFPQAYLLAGAEAAAQTMIALYYRELTGEGQHVDVSIQQSIVPLTAQAIPFWQLRQEVLERAGAFRTGLTSRTRQRQTWECKDGLVNFVIYGSLGGAKRNKALVDWMEEEDFDIGYLKQIDFSSWDVQHITQEEWAKIETPISKFFKAHTKEKLFEEGVKRGCAIVPVSSPSDLANSPHLKARGFWIDVEHPELNTTLKYPGAFAKFSETPCQFRRRAPLIGEHNMEIYHNELGLSKDKIMALKQAGII